MEAGVGLDPDGRALVELLEVVRARGGLDDEGEAGAVQDGRPLDRVPPGAAHVPEAVVAVGFEWARPEDVIDKIEEEVAELREAALHETPERAEEEMGDLLFSIANLARKMGIDAETALRKANTKFTKRFTALEEVFEQRGRSIHDATLDEKLAAFKPAG